MSEPATWYAFCVPSTPRTTVSTLPSVEVTLRTSSSIKMYLQTEAQKAAALSTNTSVSFGRRATGSPSSSTFESVVTLPVLLYSSGAFCSPCSQIRQSSLYWSPLAPRYFSGQSAARAVAATSAQTSGPRHLMAAVVGRGPSRLGGRLPRAGGGSESRPAVSHPAARGSVLRQRRIEAGNPDSLRGSDDGRGKEARADGHATCSPRAGRRDACRLRCAGRFRGRFLFIFDATRGGLVPSP